MNYKIPSDKKSRHNDITTTDNHKIWTSTKTRKLDIIRNRYELSKNVLFIKFEPLCQKL